MKNIKIWVCLVMVGAVVGGGGFDLKAQTSSEIWRLETKIDRVSTRVDRVESDVRRLDTRVQQSENNIRQIDADLAALERRVKQLEAGGAAYDRSVEAKIDLACVDRLYNASTTTFNSNQVLSALNSCREVVDPRYCYKESEVSSAECFTKATAICIHVLTPDQAGQFEAACKTHRFRCLGSR